MKTGKIIFLVCNKLKLVLLVLVFSMVLKPLSAQEFDSKLQSVFIYQITYYFQWPDDTSEVFTIGIMGSSSLIDELHKLAAAKRINGKAIIIKQFSDASSITGCNILFIPYKESTKIDEVKEAVKGEHTMIMSEKPGMAALGACINFVNIDGTMKFEFNVLSCKDAGLKSAPKIEQLAILIE